MSVNSRIEKPDTKAKITETALDLFANQGYHKTSISQIASKVGVSKSLIYNYFDSKDHLLEHIIKTSIQRNTALLSPHQFESLESLDDLMNYLENIIFDLKSNPSYYRLLILLTLQGSVKQKIMHDLIKEKERFMPLLQNILHNHKVDDPEKMSYMFGALFDGLVLHYLYMEEEYPIDELFVYFFHQFKSLLDS